jgi:DNA-binding NtrC family response regulator
LFPESSQIGGSPAATTFQEGTRRFQREFLVAALEREDWNVAGAARALDLTRTHVYNLMATLSIKRPDSVPDAATTRGGAVRSTDSAPRMESHSPAKA